MEKNNWQYFISTLMNIYLNGQVGGDQFLPEQENEVINYMQSLEGMAEMYKRYYDLVAIYFRQIIQNMPHEEYEEIFQDLVNHNIHFIMIDLSAERITRSFYSFLLQYWSFSRQSKLYYSSKI